jgi:hypothetical protein
LLDQLVLRVSVRVLFGLSPLYPPVPVRWTQCWELVAFLRRLRMVLWATPKYSAAADVCRYSLNLFIGYVPLAPIAPVMRQRAKRQV